MKVSAENTKSIDVLNIGLIILSLIIAFKIPFELFLFSYAVLGPLHYLTEINWLNDKNYFVKEKKWMWLFVVIAVLLTIPVILLLPAFKSMNGVQLVRSMYNYSTDFFFSFFFVTFLFAISLVYLKKWQHILISIAAVIAGTVAILKYKLFSIAFLGMFLPTILHVYLFTWLFMIYGTLKTRNKAGIISCVLLLLCPIVIFTSNINAASYHISDAVQSNFLKSDFQNVSSYIAQLFGVLNDDGKFHLMSEAGIKIQIFIAFCYTYHYLNWFSKTSIIGWNKNLTKPKFFVVLALWLAALGLYWYDYKIGFAALFTISLIHVFFEFPLNVVCVQGIFQGIFGKAKTAKQ